MPVRFDFPSRRFYTTEEELGRRYTWDVIEATVDELPKSESLERMAMNEEDSDEVFGA